MKVPEAKMDEASGLLKMETRWSKRYVTYNEFASGRKRIDKNLANLLSKPNAKRFGSVSHRRNGRSEQTECGPLEETWRDGRVRRMRRTLSRMIFSSLDMITICPISISAQ